MTAEPIGILFAGQGAQRAGMGKPWRDTESWVLTDEVSEHCGIDVATLLLDTDEADLRRTEFAQIALFALATVAYAELRRRTGIVATAFAGHSLGEFCALAAAGALPAGPAAALVAERAEAMRRAADREPGTMASLIGTADEAERIAAQVRRAGGSVWVANLNGPRQVVLSGTTAGVEAAIGLAAARDRRVLRLPVGGAFHCPLMAPAAGRLRAALRTTPFADRHAPVVANVDAAVHDRGTDWIELAERQLTGPVRWVETMHRLTGQLGCRTLIEIGPGRTLAGLARRIIRDTPVISIDHPDAIDRVAGR